MDRQKIVTIKRTWGNPAKQILFISIQQSTALHRPPTRELRNKFGPDEDFTVEGAVSLENVTATLNFIGIEPLTSQPF